MRERLGGARARGRRARARRERTRRGRSSRRRTSSSSRTDGSFRAVVLVGREGELACRARSKDADATKKSGGGDKKAPEVEGRGRSLKIASIRTAPQCGSVVET